MPSSNTAAGGEASVALRPRQPDLALLGLRRSILLMVWDDRWVGDLTLRQLGLLATLAAEGTALSCSATAKALGISRVAVTRAATSLAASGLIRQRTNPRDRRVTLLSVTEDGLELVRRMARELTSPPVDPPSS